MALPLAAQRICLKSQIDICQCTLSPRPKANSSPIESLALRHDGIDIGYVTASLGVASALPATIAFERLLQTADDALYAAKRRGRNNVVLADGLQPNALVA
jgi:GGDEF domain-containing protein